MNASLRALLVAGLLLGLTTVQAAQISIDLTADTKNPAVPTMGDWMHFDSRIQNSGSKAVEGLVAWISLVEVTPGQEQPMDLEEWSAQKAVTGATLAPGASLTTDWPLRLIHGGDYRVVISVTDRNEQTVYTSPTLQLHIAPKPVVESDRILPVAFGVPLLIAGLMGYRRWHHRRP